MIESWKRQKIVKHSDVFATLFGVCRLVIAYNGLKKEAEDLQFMEGYTLVSKSIFEREYEYTFTEYFFADEIHNNNSCSGLESCETTN